MLTGHGQLGVAVVEQSSPQQPRIHLEVLAAQAPFDHDLPKARDAEDELTALRVDQFPRSLRQAVRLTRRPQEQMSIE